MTNDLFERALELIKYIQFLTAQSKNKIPEFALSQEDELKAIQYIEGNPKVAYVAIQHLSELHKEESPLPFAPENPSEKYVLREQYEQLKKEYEDIQSTFGRSQTSWNPWVGKNKELQRQIKDLETKNADLNKEIAQLGEKLEKRNLEYENVDSRLNQAMSQLSERRRVVSDTYASVGFRPDVVSMRYRQFKQQEFHELSVKILDHIREKSDDSKKQILEVKAFLSETVIMSAYRFIQGEVTIAELNNLVEQVKGVLLPEPLQKEMIDIINRGFGDRTGPELEEVDGHRKEKMNEAIQSVMQKWVLPEELTGKVKQFCEDAFKLIGDMCPINIKSSLWLVDPNAPFDSSRCTVMPDSSDSGFVVQTIFPGYSIGDRIMERAEVTTSSTLSDNKPR